MKSKNSLKDKDIKKAIDTIVVIIDTREHLPNEITKCFDKYNIKWERKKLKSGDYSAKIPKNEELGINEEINLEDILCIERKMSADEISTNVSTNRERFKREFERTKAQIIIVIEGNTYKDIAIKNYNSKLTPNQFLGSLHGIADEYGIPFIFIDKGFSALYIYNVLKYRLRNILKNNY